MEMLSCFVFHIIATISENENPFGFILNPACLSVALNLLKVKTGLLNSDYYGI